MGGTLVARSAGPGLGATFTLDLPASTTLPPETASPAGFADAFAR